MLFYVIDEDFKIELDKLRAQSSCEIHLMIKFESRHYESLAFEST